MKRFLTILTILFLTLSASAQEHLQFMGIPITGNINSFAQKLAAKGIRVSPQNKLKNLPNARIFEGVWSREKAFIQVDYFGSNKTVCKVTVMIDSNNASALELFQGNIEFDITKKYGDRCRCEDTYRKANQEIHLFHISQSSSDGKKIGTISTYIDEEDMPYVLYFIYNDKYNNDLKYNTPNYDI